MLTYVLPSGRTQVAGVIPRCARNDPYVLDTHETARGFHRGPIVKKTLLLAFVDDLVVRFDDVVLRLCATRAARGAAGRPRRARARRAGVRGCSRALALGIERLPGLAEHAVQLFLRRPNLVHVVAAKRLP